MTTVRDAIALAESGRTDAARQAFARHIADGAPQAHKSYAIFLQQRGESDVTAFVGLCCCCCCAAVALCRRRRKGGRYRAFEGDDPVEEVELGKRAPLPAKTSTSLPGASNLPPAERPSSDDDDAGSAEEWEARDGGGFELRIHS